MEYIIGFYLVGLVITSLSLIGHYKFMSNEFTPNESWVSIIMSSLVWPYTLYDHIRNKM